MAEPISLASGVLTLTGFAFKASLTLFKTIQSFRYHPKRVRDLHDELEALGGVLSVLQETVETKNGPDLSALNLPLLRCGNACKELQQEIMKCSSRSDADRTSFRDWAKLKYMGDDIASFTQLLAGYKATINIALADASLRNSSITVTSLEAYRQLLKTATDDIEAHLQNMDEKLETILGRAATTTASDAKELQTVQDERKSARKCLEICGQLSAHINQIQLENRRGEVFDTSGTSSTRAEDVTDEGLQECQETLNNTADKLERILKTRLDRMVLQAGANMSPEARTELESVREEWETAHKCKDLYAKADMHLKENVSKIDNYATGDAVQFMVSTDGKTLHGKNQGLGWRTRQVGGLLNDASVQQLSRDIFGSHIQSSDKDSSRDSPAITTGSGLTSEFDGRYGQGFKLTTI